MSVGLRCIISSFFKPFGLLRSEPYPFLAWVSSAFVIGLACIWAPIFVGLIRGEELWGSFVRILATGSAASFCVVTLADGLGNMIGVTGTGRTKTTANIRAVAASLSVLLIVLNVILMAGNFPSNSNRFICIQTTLIPVSMFLASYLYCFRGVDWEQGVEAVAQAEDNSIAALTNATTNRVSDDSGVTL